MSHNIQKRGSVYYFRRRIPNALLDHYDAKREIVHSLGVKDRAEAIVRARKFSVELDDKWQSLRAAPKPDPVPAPDAMTPAEFEAWDRARLEYEEETADQHMLEEWAEEEAEEEANRLARVIRIIERQRAEAGTPPLDPIIRAAIAPQLTIAPAVPEVPVAPSLPPKASVDSASSVATPGEVSPTLGTVTAHFLNNYDKSAPMFKKHQAALGLLLEVLGDVPVSQIRQLQIDAYFDMLCRLPPRWADEVRRQGVSASQLAEQEHAVTLSPETFEYSYMASIRPFLAEAKRLFGDAGFPRNLTVEGSKYKGTQTEGARKQRAIRPHELKRLFEGNEYAAFAADPGMAPEYWLPLIGLYTGARVNEICQLNPQCDIRQEDDIWFFDFTEESEADERVTKSVKTTGSRRKTPIHSQLLKLGFLTYVERLRAQGATILFPKWVPTRGRASPAALDWFREFLRETGLRDETHGQCLLGMHAFRHTLLNYGFNNHVPNVEVITGHAGEASRVVRGYRGEMALRGKKAIIEQIRFDVEPPRPTYNHSPAMA